MWFIYLLLCQDGSLYAGVTNDLEKRLRDHFAGKGCRYTRSHPPKKLVYQEELPTRSEALKREAEIKSWPRVKKEILIKAEKNKCFQCGLCCRLFLINLNEKEYRSGKFKTELEEFGPIKSFRLAASCGANILKQNRDGSCIYLKGAKCSIHQGRPRVCRKFFCDSNKKRFQAMIDQVKKAR